MISPQTDSTTLSADLDQLRACGLIEFQEDGGELRCHLTPTAEQCLAADWLRELRARAAVTAGIAEEVHGRTAGDLKAMTLLLLGAVDHLLAQVASTPAGWPR